MPRSKVNLEVNSPLIETTIHLYSSLFIHSTPMIKSLTTLLFSILLFVGLLLSNPATFQAMAAVTPDAAKQVIKEADSVQEATRNLKALDSSEILKNHGTMDTTKDVLKTSAQDRVTDQLNSTPLISSAESELKEAVETVKEKLNLDEPIPESTKKFGRQITGKANDVADEAEKVTDTVTGKSQQVIEEIADKSKTAAKESQEAIRSNTRDMADQLKPGYYQTKR